MEIKQRLHMQAVKFCFDDKFKVMVSTSKLESSERTVVIDIDETEVTLNSPDFTQEQFTSGHVEQLRKIQKNIQAETHLKLKVIDDQIENLLAIEDKT